MAANHSNPGIRVQRDEYAGMALLSDFGWSNADIGRLWGIKGTQTGDNIRKWREGRIPEGTILDDNRRGGYATHRSEFTEDVRGYMVRCKQEVASYLEGNPGATVFDVALECHMSNCQARDLMTREVRCQR